MKPQVSIIIPCHNAAPWLAATVASALAQTWNRRQVIVVNDGSTDASLQIAEGFIDRGVTVLTQPNRGAAAARNAGLAVATGDYLQFLDADDLLAPDKLERQLAVLGTAPDRAVAHAAWARFQHDPAEACFTPEPVWTDAPPVDWLVSSWSGGGMMHPAAWLVPAAVARAAGPWDETLSLDDDGEYFARVVLASTRVVHAREARVYYRTHPAGSLSQRKSAAAWRSSHRVCQLVQNAALAREDSPRVRRACALNHLRFAFHAWPHDDARALARTSLAAAHELAPDVRRPTVGRRFEFLARLMGWKLARRLQHRFRLP